jgi:hypothetical protein
MRTKKGKRKTKNDFRNPYQLLKDFMIWHKKDVFIRKMLLGKKEIILYI